MSDNDKKSNRKQDNASTETAPDQDVGQKELQQVFDEANEKGYFGDVPDPTPNENYTVLGNDLPTPETDRELAAEAAQRRRGQ